MSQFPSWTSFFAARTRSTMALVLSLLLAAGTLLWLPTPGAYAGGPILSSNPVAGSTIDTGSALVGQSTSATLTLTTNYGSNISVSHSLSGANTGEFNVTPTTLSLTHPESAVLTITCTPLAAGTPTATLTVTAINGLSSESYTYPLTCTGTNPPAPGYGSTPAPGSTIDVGSAIIGQSGSTVLTVSETGNATLDVTNHVVSGPNAGDFAVTPASLSIADGGASQDLTITCTPAAVGTRTATLTVYHNASAPGATRGPAGGSATYDLTCVGTILATPGYDSTPAPGGTIRVGDAVLGASASTTLVIREIGSAALQITSYSLSGPNAADFSVTPATLTIPDGGSAQSLVIRCTPSAVGTRNAVLTVNHNASGSPASYALTCSATAMQPEVYFPMMLNP